jgi:hypothetical protein
MLKVEQHPNNNVKKYCLKHFLTQEYDHVNLISDYVFTDLFNLLN